MQVVKDPQNLPSEYPLHVAIGMFDGVHIGHQAVVDSAVHAAKMHGGKAAVLTFTPHPSVVLRPEDPTLLMQMDEQKEERLSNLGLDILIWQSFTRDLSSVPAADFVRELKRRFPSLSSIHVGENFRFGRGRDGDIETMLNAARESGVHVISTERVRYDGEPVSSTRIRKLLNSGRIDYANDLFGYVYYSLSVVTPGRQLGRTIGFPTLNLPWDPPCKPSFGVYAVKVRKAHEPDEAKTALAVANYGLRPTVEQDAHTPLLEVHILEEANATAFKTGERLRVEWLKFMRAEAKFENLERLKAQISEDRENAIRFFGL